MLRAVLVSIALAGSASMAQAEPENLSNYSSEASEDTWWPIPFPIPCPGGSGGTDYCRRYNRDGITCNQVGYSEGQYGYPWGPQNGQFQCFDSCLKYIDPNQYPGGGNGGYPGGGNGGYPR